MADSDSDSRSSSSSRKKGRGDSSRDSSSSSSGGGNPYSILSLLRSSLSGSGSSKQSNVRPVSYKTGGKVRKAKGRTKRRSGRKSNGRS